MTSISADPRAILPPIPDDQAALSGSTAWFQKGRCGVSVTDTQRIKPRASYYTRPLEAHLYPSHKRGYKSLFNRGYGPLVVGRPTENLKPICFGEEFDPS